MQHDILVNPLKLNGSFLHDDGRFGIVESGFGTQVSFGMYD